MILSFSLTSNLALAQEKGTVVYFMKTNSSAKLYLKIKFHENMVVPLNPIMYTYPEIYNLYYNDTIKVVPTESSVQTTPPYGINTTETITAKNNITGTFEIFVGGCTNSSFVPLVVGLNESKVDPQIFHNFHSGWVSLSCPPVDAFISQTKIIGYSGLIPKIISENSNTWINPTQSSTIPEFPFVIPILIISIGSLITFYRIRFRN
jgi:hypothetical protein